MLAEQIDFLGGVPTVEVPTVPSATDTHHGLQLDLELEEQQLQPCRERIEQAQELSLPEVAEALRPLPRADTGARARASGAARPRARRDLCARLRQIGFWNRGAETLYGWSAAEAIGVSPRTLLQTRLPRPLPELEAERAAVPVIDGDDSADAVKLERNLHVLPEGLVPGRHDRVHSSQRTPGEDELVVLLSQPSLSHVARHARGQPVIDAVEQEGVDTGGRRAPRRQ